jgi:ribosomal protein L23
VLNYVNELKRFHGIDISDYIPQNFLTITANYEPLENEQIKLKYAPEIAEKLIQQANEIAILNETYHSEKFAINIRQNLYITKRRDEADFTVAIAKDSPNQVEIVKELKDPADTHRYSFNTLVAVVHDKLSKENIRIDYEKGFNSYVLNLVIDFYNVKADPKYAYKHLIGKQEQYTYSQQFVDFILSEIKKNPSGFVESLKKSKK